MPCFGNGRVLHAVNLCVTVAVEENKRMWSSMEVGISLQLLSVHIDVAVKHELLLRVCDIPGTKVTVA